MTPDRKPEVNFPSVYPKCDGCGFARRTAEIAQKKFPQAETINIECFSTGGGGIHQVTPGEFVESPSMRIAGVPDAPRSGYEAEHIEGFVPQCSHYIPDAADRNPSTSFDWLFKCSGPYARWQRAKRNC